MGGGAVDLDAQRVAVTGRLYHGGRSATPLARAWVVLHEVSMGGRGGPIDSARSDARGAYALAIARPDSDAIYVVSSWYHGIAYFSEPIRPARRSAVSVAPLTVYDTSATGPALRVARRVITIARPQRDGTRDVLELVAREPRDRDPRRGGQRAPRVGRRHPVPRYSAPGGPRRRVPPGRRP